MRQNKYHIVRLVMLLAIALLVHSFAGCDHEADPSWGVIWSGTVTDSVHGYAIDSAQIDYFLKYPLDTFRLPLLYTNAQGKFRFDTEGIGPYYLTCRKHGYKSQVRTISSPTRNANVGNLNFLLVPD